MRHQMAEWARYPDRKGCVLQRFVRSRSRRPAVYRIVWRDEPHSNSGRTRNFGFCITAEARHFVVLRIRHLEVMIWKHDPDPNTGKK